VVLVFVSVDKKIFSSGLRLHTEIAAFRKKAPQIFWPPNCIQLLEKCKSFSADPGRISPSFSYFFHLLLVPGKYKGAARLKKKLKNGAYPPRICTEALHFKVAASIRGTENWELF